jgi:hypothetical protein
MRASDLTWEKITTGLLVIFHKAKEPLTLIEIAQKLVAIYKIENIKDIEQRPFRRRIKSRIDHLVMINEIEKIKSYTILKTIQYKYVRRNARQANDQNHSAES